MFKNFITATLIATATPLMTQQVVNLSETLEYGQTQQFTYHWVSQPTIEGQNPVGFSEDWELKTAESQEGTGIYKVNSRQIQYEQNIWQGTSILTSQTTLVTVYKVQALGMLTSTTLQKYIWTGSLGSINDQYYFGEINSNEFNQWYTYSERDNQGQPPQKPDEFWQDLLVEDDFENNVTYSITEPIGYQDTKYFGLVVLSDWGDELYYNDYSSINFTAVSRQEEPTDIAGLLWQILGMPFAFFSTAFNFTFFAGTPYAINVANVLLSVVSALLLIFIIRKVTH